VLGLVFALPAVAQSQSVKVGSERLCGPESIFVNGQVNADLAWEAMPDQVARIPIRQTCWLRLTRPLLPQVKGNPNDQYLEFENSWGSNFSLYDPKGALLARSTVDGERFRLQVDKIRVYYTLTPDTPAVLYAKVESLHNTSTVRHTVRQQDSRAILLLQRRALQHGAAGWLLFGAAVFSFLFFVIQRNWHYALFSGFALVFSLTLFSDRGELAPLGLTASSDVLSLSYPLSGLMLAWLALVVGRFAVHTPWVARAVGLVIVLYGSLAVAQLAIIVGFAWPIRWIESFSDYVYNTAALLQLFVFWGGFQAWRRGDKAGLLLAIGIAPLILFEIQISDWLVDLSPGVAEAAKVWLGSSLRITSYLVLPMMFFIAIAYRSHKAQRDAIRLAQQDHLTNLPNRDHFLRMGQQVLDSHKGACLLAINIDRLKAINDVLGFQVGDAVIVEAGQRLAGIGEGVVARVQTTQFCLLLPDPQQLPEVRRRIEAAFATPVQVLNQTLDVALSIGLARNAGEAMPRLLRDAEIALAVAKATKVNWLAYEPAMDTTRPESLSLLSELNRAIVDSELRLFLQPKVNLADGHVTGAEALVRWQHPTRGMVPPHEFIPFAEQTGKISALTLWVIREGARLVALWRAEGRPIIVSLNISTHDLREPQFVERVTRLVTDQGARPSDLRLEVTESGMMDDPETSLTVLNALRDAGFTLSIDDFGTGYSSLSYLQRMPVAELKIDRSFVRDVKAGSDGAALLDSIIALGHRMGLSVVAEGAETAQECALLQSLGCDYVQGWFVAKAMPVPEFDQWRQSHDPFDLNTA
jgi:diguanylate cyclase (GGDEF)-like protein